MSPLPKKLATRLAGEFADKEYAHAYMEEHVITRIAAQVLALRQQRGWTQQELSRRAHVAQERISKIESADFDSLTMKTLHKLAEAFDVAVQIAFHSFSDGILDVVNLSKDRLCVTSREDSLDRFCRNKIMEVRDGWESIDPARLSPVASIASKAPVDPTPNQGWVSLSAHG